MVARHEITVVTASWPGAPREEEIDGVRYLHLGPPRKEEGLSRAGFTWTMNQVCRGAKRWGADLLVIDISPFTPCFAPWLSVVPCAGIVQSWTDKAAARAKHGPMGSVAVRIRDWTLRQFKWLIAVSPTILQELQACVGRQRTIPLIPYGVDSSLLALKTHENPYFLSMGRLERFQKGLDLLVEAFAILHTQLPDMQLIIAGSGSYERDLRALVAEKGLSEAVEFVGWVTGEEKARLLSGCLAFCIPSRVESWGLVAMEAAACGKAVIGFDAPGVRDSVRNKKTGILVPLEDTEAYARAMVRIAEDAELRRTLGEAGRRWASQFTWDETARKQEEFYLYVLERESRASRT
jgi:glycosyltransferase involved in cell wall biosynthesis